MTFLDIMKKIHDEMPKPIAGGFDMRAIEKAHKKNKKRRWVNKGRHKR